MNNIYLYIYKFNTIKDFKIESFFSDYRLDKINNHKDESYIYKMIEIENILYKVLNKHENISKLEFLVGKFGKINLLNSDIKFNISHSKEYLIIGVSNSDLGVDLEYIDEKRFKIKEKITDQKISDINELIKLYTIKESFIKYYGLSILYNLKNIMVNNDQIISKDYENLYYISNKFGNYYYTVCAKNEFNLSLIEINSMIFLLK